MASAPSAATLKRRRRAAAKTAVDTATSASETEEDGMRSDHGSNLPLSRAVWRINKATGRYENLVSSDVKADELDGIAEDTNSSSNCARVPVPVEIRSLARDTAEVARHATDLTLAAHLISPLSGSLMQLWTHNEWLSHSSTWRFWLHCKRWLFSSVLNRIKIPVLALAVYAMLIRSVNELLGGLLSVPLAAVTLQGASIGLLLVFRTNQASARVTEARSLFGTLSRHCAIIADALYCHADLMKHADAVAEVGRLLGSLGFLLKAGLRHREAAMSRGAGGAHDIVAILIGEGELVEWIFHGTATRTAHKSKARAGIAPYRRALLRLRQVLGALPLSRSLQSDEASSSYFAAVNSEVAASLATQLEGLAAVGGSCFKLLSTPIPPTYQRHVTRGMLLWLAALPLALPRDLGFWPVLFAVISTAYLTLGIDEIAVQHEEPFSVLPLHELALGNARAVATSLASKPPPLPPSIRLPATQLHGK